MCTAAYSRAWRAKNSGYDQAWYAKNIDAQRERGRKRAAEHKESAHERGRKWRTENPHRHTAKERKRYAAKLRRIPKWLTPDDIKTIEIFYETANIFKKFTGVKYAVDHIYPLQGKTVSGLHVPINLQVITATQNARKHNRHPEDFRR